jgi:UDP-N-acetylglucosamine 1-carboxyvinyltransferase
MTGIMGNRKMKILGPSLLKGVVGVAGAKNASLPELAAALLSDGAVFLENVPKVEDIASMTEALAHLGVKILPGTNGLELLADAVSGTHVPAEVVGISRASILVLAPLLTRMGLARVALPRGCPIGGRQINFHLDGLRTLGARVEEENGHIVAACKRLVGSRFRFPQKSVTGTENLIMAAALARGETRLENCAQEPEVVDLVCMLNNLGAQIDMEGETITIQGRDGTPLAGGRHLVIPDRIEAGTWLIAGAFPGNEITVRGGQPSHLTSLLDLLRAAGAEVILDEMSMTVRGRELAPQNIVTEAFPGFPTDLQAQMMVLLTQARGLSQISETIFENRMQHAHELCKMGARIEVVQNAAVVRGPVRLQGAEINATDLRASAALLLAASRAEGTTQINNVRQLFRGYEDLPQKMVALGARLEIFQSQEVV